MAVDLQMGCPSNKKNRKSLEQKMTMQQMALPSLLCRALWPVIQGQCYAIGIICVSPSQYNSSETKFSVQFGERLAKISTNPVPSKLINIFESIKSMSKELEEHSRILPTLKETNKMYPIRKGKMATIVNTLNY